MHYATLASLILASQLMTVIILTLIAVQNTQNSTLNPLPPRTLLLLFEADGSCSLLSFL